MKKEVTDNLIKYIKMVWAHRILSKGIEGSKRLRSSFKIYMDTDYLTVTEVNSSDIVKEPGR